MSNPEVPYRSGFVALVGRPNAGKTTLTNRLVGDKVGIVSNRPQTTRHAIRGVVHRPEGQLVLVDTPGLHKPKSLLGQRLNDVVRDTLTEVDVIVFCIPADQPVGAGDAFIARQLANVSTPVVLVVTKTDAASKKQITEQLVAASQLVEAREVVPVSAVADDQVDLLADLLIGMLPEGPPMYPADQLTDDDLERQISELVREAALEKVRQEVPHSLAVSVEEIIRKPDPRDPRRCSPSCTCCCTASGPARSRCCWARAPPSRPSAARPGGPGAPARRPGAPVAARHRAGGVAGRPQEAAAAGLLSTTRRRSTATRASCCGCRSSVRPTASSPCSPAAPARSARWPRACAAPRASSAPGWSPSATSTCSCTPAGNLDIVSQAESLHSYGPAIVADYRAYTAGTAVLETADRLTAEEKEPSLRMFLLVIGALRSLAEQAHPPGLVLDAFLLRAMSVAGWEPALSDCARCAEPGRTGTSPCPGVAWCARPAGPPGRRCPAPSPSSCWTRCSPATGHGEASQGINRREGSGLVAALLQWHLERGLRSLSLVDRS